MTPQPSSPVASRTGWSIGPWLLGLSLIAYGGAMLALPIYLFGPQIGLWLCGALLAGGGAVLVVLCGANRIQPPPASQPCHVRLTPTPGKVWVRPRIIPFH